MLRHILTLLLIKLPLQLLGLPILAVVLLFVPKDKETLPSAFRWWDNYELHLRDDGDDGLSGPDYHRSKWKNPEGWIARFSWLALRNPINYFQYRHLGFQTKKGWTATVENPNVGTQSYRDAGIRKIKLINGDGKEYWEWYAVIKLFGNVHFRARLGYKIGDTTDLADDEWVQWVFSVTPFKVLKPKALSPKE